jgi:hypothetical protein
LFGHAFQLASEFHKQTRHCRLVHCQGFLLQPSCWSRPFPKASNIERLQRDGKTCCISDFSLELLSERSSLAMDRMNAKKKSFQTRCFLDWWPCILSKQVEVPYVFVRFEPVILDGSLLWQTRISRVMVFDEAGNATPKLVHYQFPPTPPPPASLPPPRTWLTETTVVIHESAIMSPSGCSANVLKLFWMRWHLDGIAVLFAPDDLHLSPAL